MDDLALQIARVNHVEVHQAQGADAGRGQIKRERRTETAGTDAQNARGLELLLALDAHFGQDEVARVAREIGDWSVQVARVGKMAAAMSGGSSIFSLSGRRERIASGDQGRSRSRLGKPTAGTGSS